MPKIIIYNSEGHQLNNFDIAILSAMTDVNVADYVPVYDTSANTTKKASVEELFEGAINTATAETSIANGDYFPIYDVSASAFRKMTFANVSAGITGVPTGTIIMFGSATPPTGYLACDGSAVSRSTYSALFAVTSTTWGVGDGSSTFNVPDLRGRAPIGNGTGSGLTARTIAATVGTETHTLTGAESGLPAHSHTTTYTGFGGSGIHGRYDGGNALQSGTNTTGPLDASSAHNNMQPSLVVHFCIKT